MHPSSFPLINLYKKKYCTNFNPLFLAKPTDFHHFLYIYLRFTPNHTPLKDECSFRWVTKLGPAYFKGWTSKHPIHFAYILLIRNKWCIGRGFWRLNLPIKKLTTSTRNSFEVSSARVHCMYCNTLQMLSTFPMEWGHVPCFCCMWTDLLTSKVFELGPVLHSLTLSVFGITEGRQSICNVRHEGTITSLQAQAYYAKNKNSINESYGNREMAVYMFKECQNSFIHHLLW